MGKITGMEARNRDLSVTPQVFADCIEVLRKSAGKTASMYWGMLLIR